MSSTPMKIAHIPLIAVAVSMLSVSVLSCYTLALMIYLNNILTVNQPQPDLRDIVKKLGESGKLPKSLGIIPDGNRRFAQRESLPRSLGHMIGGMKIIDIIKQLSDLNIDELLFYLLSVDNIKKRSSDEVKFLYSVLVMIINYILSTDIAEEKNLRFTHAGDPNILPEYVNNAIHELVEKTKNNTGMNVVLCVGYLGKDEITRALKGAISEKGEDTGFEDVLRHCDVTKEVDMIIRTGKADRTSDFLTFQSAHSEFIFIPKFFPDLTEEDILLALVNYTRKNKSKGGNISSLDNNDAGNLNICSLVGSHIPTRCAGGFVRAGLNEVANILYQELGWMLKSDDW